MMRKRSKIQKRLAKVMLAALLCTGGVHPLLSPSVAEAGFASVSEYKINGSVSQDGTTVSFTQANFGTENYGYGNQAFLGNEAPVPTSAIGYEVTITSAPNWRMFVGAGIPSGTVSGNKVIVEGTDTNISQEVVGGRVFGTDSGQSGTVTENEVIVNAGKISAVYGGDLSGYGAVAGDAKNNTVTINGGEIRNIYGGVATNGAADENTVNVNSGTIGTSEVDSIVGGQAPTEANKNEVSISGGTINSTIWGGRSETGNADDNTVTISGTPTFAEGITIHGAAAYQGDATNNTVNILVNGLSVGTLIGGEQGDGHTSSGNTLNIAAKGVTTGAVYGFQNMNFYLPKDIANGNTMLTIKGFVSELDGTVYGNDLTDVTFGVAALQGVNLQKGNTVNLVVGSNGLKTDDTLKTAASSTLVAPKNLATDTKYELSISKKGTDTILATVDNVTNTDPDPKPTPDPDPDPKPTPKPDPKPDYSDNERIKSLVETRAAMVTMLNAGTDLLTGQGMSNAAEAAADTREGSGFNAFGAVSIGKLRAESGSHVDTKGIGLNLGFARELENSKGKLLFGPVVEYGHGSYDSYQDNGIKADGKTSYWGLGVIAKQTNNNGLYYEGSLRVGRVKSDYDSDLSPVTHASYDSSATYWAAHAGIGKLMDIGKDNTIDVYGKYFYSRTGSDSVTVHGTAGDEDINFSAVNSHRLRIGTRLTHAMNEKSKIYGGLAYQYEFSGDARATYNGGSTPSPSVKGSSGMIELGWQVKPGKSPMTIDLGVTGWVGKQRGITANLQANWTF